MKISRLVKKLVVAQILMGAWAILPVEALTTNVSTVAELMAVVNANSTDIPSGSTIVLAAGTYDLSEVEPTAAPDSYGPSSILIRDKKLILKGADATSWRDSPDRTTGVILKGTNTARIIYAYAGSGRSSQFFNITFDGGVAASGKNGGGLFFNGTEGGGFASNCVFRNCRAAQGGGTHHVTAYDCLYEECEAVKVDEDSNSGRGGGAIGTSVNGNYKYTNDFIRCEFWRNKAARNGGAICHALMGFVGNCLFMTNSAGTGGAIYTVDDTYTSGGVQNQGLGATSLAYDCTFIGNVSTNTEGGACRHVKAARCAFTGNSAQKHRGGAIHLGSAVDCAFTNNTCGSTSRGGAVSRVDCTGCTFSGAGNISCGAFDRCVFDHVQATYLLDCLRNVGAPLYMTNCLVSNCSVGRLVLNEGQYSEFVNCTFADNTIGVGVTAGLSYTIYNSPGAHGTSQIYYPSTNVLVNCIFSGNKYAGNDMDLRLYKPETETDYGYCAIKMANCLYTTGLVGGANIDEGAETLVQGNPRFVAGDSKYPGLPYYSILYGSQARNAGVNAAWMSSAIDLAGNQRLFDDVVDIGCYECLLHQAGTIVVVK